MEVMNLLALLGQTDQPTQRVKGKFHIQQDMKEAYLRKT